MVTTTYSDAIDPGTRKAMMNMNTKAEILATATVSDPRWAAVVARDPQSDGTFFYSLRTTGVYCRPSCPARPARLENVAFHAIRPMRNAPAFAPACAASRISLRWLNSTQSWSRNCATLLETSEQAPSLDELARQAQLSAYHLHRVFKGITGLTPKAYAGAHRTKRVRAELGRSGTVIDAIYGAGYKSGGRFYADADKVLGMTPTRYRAGGANTEIRFAIGECSLGAILVARSDRRCARHLDG
jgi:AraC family transcriptional regulator of adaptative response/methylated-DNA-[protein]-cysteine methyltransferase